MFAEVSMERGRDANISSRDKPHPSGETKRLFSLFQSSLFILMWEGGGFVWGKSQIQDPGVSNSESGLSRAQGFDSLL